MVEDWLCHLRSFEYEYRFTEYEYEYEYEERGKRKEQIRASARTEDIQHRASEDQRPTSASSCPARWSMSLRVICCMRSMLKASIV